MKNALFAAALAQFVVGSAFAAPVPVKQRRNGMRADLAEKIARLQPAFMRFPGGCIVEVSPRTFTIDVSGSTVTDTLPPHSLTVMHIPITGVP